MNPHKHVELIKQWADGAEIEYRYPKDDGSWSLWKYLTQCVFHDWYEYRIKPEVTQFNTQLHPLTDTEINDIYDEWQEWSGDPVKLYELFKFKAQEK